MMKSLLLIPVLSAFTAGIIPVVPAVAADQTDGASESIAVAKMMCEKRYVTDDAAYQSGVDVDGNAVVAADINSSPIDVPDYMEVPLTYDLSKALQISLNDGGELKAVVGSLKLFKDGHVEFNGIDVTENASKFCGTQLVVPTTEDEVYRAPAPVQKPVAGSVAASTTEPEPAPQPAFKIPRETVNMTR
ncbi:MAG: hypothetical protein RBR86_01455 [Pseudobdellovibrionaceae bacterium]|jgi:hypothetical protein|nr:hypothetical protein [Pseudobdellovibrionaceae bacterium]